MKKILAITLALVLSIALSGFASAAGNSYTVEEYGVTLEIPDGFLVITPDNMPDEPLLLWLGMTHEDMIDMFDTMPLYLDAVSLDLSREITLTIQESTLADYHEMGPTVLEMLLPEMTSVYSEFDTEVTAADVYIHNQTPFVRVYFEPSVYAQGGVLYSTVLDGHSYTLTMHTDADAISEEDDALAASIVDSMYFENCPDASLPEAESFQYPAGSLTAGFTVPAGWQQIEVKQYSGAESVGFSSLSDTACNIVYVAADTWKDLSPLQRLFTTRGKVDNSILTRSEVADMLGASYSDVEMVTLAGNEYYRADFEQVVSRYGMTFHISSIALICVRNAETHMFLYTGNENTGLYEDFEAMVASANYPEPVSGGIAPIVYILIVLAAIAAIIIVFVSRNNKKKLRLAEEEEAAQRKLREEARKAAEEARKAKAAEEEAKFMACPSCGVKIERNSTFCGHCGEKTIPGENEE